MAVLVKSRNGLAYSSIKTINGLAVASLKTLNGLDVTAGSFSPTDIAGLVLWLQGDNAPSGSIANWPDNSGNGYDAVQATGGLQPTKVTGAINGHDAISTSPGNLYLDSPAPWPTDKTVFFVARLLTTPGVYTGIDAIAVAGGSPTNGEVFLTNVFGSGSQTYFAGFGTAYLNGALASAPPANFPQTAYAVGSIKSAGGSSDTSIRIGHETGGASGYNSQVEIAEIIVYDSDLSTGNREAVEDYLGTKYGITITH